MCINDITLHDILVNFHNLHIAKYNQTNETNTIDVEDKVTTQNDTNIEDSDQLLVQAVKNENYGAPKSTLLSNVLGVSYPRKS